MLSAGGFYPIEAREATVGASSQPTVRDNWDAVQVEDEPWDAGTFAREGDARDSLVVEVHPWRRYWARWVDEVLGIVIAGISVAAMFPELIANGSSDGWLTLLGIFGCIFLEAGALAAWGTTPGKSLMGIRVLDRNGNRLSYRTALARAFRVWWAGMAMGIPIFAIVTMLVAKGKLEKHGRTSWDRDYDIDVIHAPIGSFRWIALIAIIGLTLLLGAVGSV